MEVKNGQEHKKTQKKKREVEKRRKKHQGQGKFERMRGSIGFRGQE